MCGLYYLLAFFLLDGAPQHVPREDRIGGQTRGSESYWCDLPLFFAETLETSGRIL